MRGKPKLKRSGTSNRETRLSSSRELLGRLSAEWTASVLAELAGVPDRYMRYSELKSRLSTSKVLYPSRAVHVVAYISSPDDHNIESRVVPYCSTTGRTPPMTERPPSMICDVPVVNQDSLLAR